MKVLFKNFLKVEQLIFGSIIFIGIWGIFFVSIFLYFPFSAEDSYIVGRYAYNFANYFQLAYNIEEPISALTSPLHAVLEGILFFIFKYDPVIIWKFFSTILFSVSVYMLSNLLFSKRQKILFHISVVLSSSSILWIVGGLETPLLLFLVSLCAFIFLKDHILGLNTCAKLGFLFGLIFLTRFDAIIFIAPIAIFAAWSNKNNYKKLAMIMILPFAITAIWFIFSKGYYGHFMPTSLFQKTPSLSISHFIAAMRGLFWVGVLPLLLYMVTKSKGIFSIDRKKGVVILALALFLLYSFTMANTHMMFGFRSFTPYLPITFVLIILGVKKYRSSVLFLFFIFQTSQIYLTYAYGINYPVSEMIEVKYLPQKYRKTFYHEYALVNIPTYVKLMSILEQQGKAIASDWNQKEIDRKAVVFTYAEGIASYAAPNLIFTGRLVTKGQCKIPDYIMGLHFVDSGRNWGGISSANAFISNKLDLYMNSDEKKMEFSVSRFDDMNKKNKKKIKKIIRNCGKAKIW